MDLDVVAVGEIGNETSQSVLSKRKVGYTDQRYLIAPKGPLLEIKHSALLDYFVEPMNRIILFTMLKQDKSEYTQPK